ncbi:hypothetical protein GGH94_000435 [Coemansia aciculifera]|uniref:Tr-type G domain-containing protein n=1 Tax=Coemansia aciculifera TaxID=417176 RepID=A0A9W8IMN3_9FUNG|nr:hypothetical protein GGH94_000435 [Coemansia aciculifera]KAJ2876952.1 hypothetical protein GGH93_000327 [Coemansia aciculifera]
MTTRDTIYSVDTACAGKQRLSVLGEGVTQLPPESDGSGNVEYKTKLNPENGARTTHLATQLQWRLAEGNGHAVYVLGVHDDGEVIGISDVELQLTIQTLENMARQLDNVHILSIDRRRLDDQKDQMVAEVHITQRNIVRRTELRVTVLGDHGAGKSTILGCLTYGEADDGRGKARLNLLRHRHEVESGRTSSITLGTIGFDTEGLVLNYANNRSAEQIFQRSRHVVTFVDTCGYAKHLKTTASAIVGHSPHVFCLVLAADVAAITTTTREYLRIAAVLCVPLMIVVTKMDAAIKPQFAAMMHELMSALDTVVSGRSKCIVTSETDSDSLAKDMMSLAVVPIFTTSAVRSVGFSELTAVLAKSRHSHASSLMATAANNGNAKVHNNLFEFHIEHVFSIDTVGKVVTGWVKAGTIEVGPKSGHRLVIGPNALGGFDDVDVTSIHALRIPSESAQADSSAALAIQPQKAIAVRKGMVVVDADYLDNGTKRVSSEFVARIAVLDPELKAMNSVIVHIRSTYRLARILDISNETTDDENNQQCGESSSWATIRLKFDDGVCDYLYAGMPVIARDGQRLTFVGHVADVV